MFFVSLMLTLSNPCLAGEDAPVAPAAVEPAGAEVPPLEPSDATAAVPPAVPAAAPAGAPQGQAIALGSMDKKKIDRVIKRHLKDIGACYDNALAEAPGLQGKVTVKFVIVLDGTVSSAATKESTMNSPALESCVNEKFMTFQFPEPKGGIVIVSYPFDFSP